MSAPSDFANTPTPPYYVVMFTNQLSQNDAGYQQMAERMVELAQQQPGFLGIESTRNNEGLGITLSYWRDEAAITAWKQNLEHQQAQALGKSRWYERYIVRVAKVEREYTNN